MRLLRSSGGRGGCAGGRGGDMDYDNQLQNSYPSENPIRLGSRTRRIEASHDRGRCDTQCPVL